MNTNNIHLYDVLFAYPQLAVVLRATTKKMKEMRHTHYPRIYHNE